MDLLVRIAETGSMTLAARQLYLTPAAVSAAVRRIEGDVGVRLFERTTRSLHLTDEGLVIIEGCRDVVERWRRALDEARGHRSALAGTVHLTVPKDLTYQVLQPLIADFSLAHPALRVVLSTSDSIRHLHRDAIDLAIRYGSLQDSRLSARKLAASPRILVAAPSYLERAGVPDGVDALLKHRCLTMELANVPVVSWRLLRGDEAHTVEMSSSPLCGDGYLVRQWAVAGMGIAFKSLLDVIDDLEAGRLVQVLPTFSGGLIPIHAVFPSRFLPARVRALLTVIEERCRTRWERCMAWRNRRASIDPNGAR